METASRGSTIWMLRLVPPVRFGRLLCGFASLAGALAVFHWSGALWSDPRYANAWPIALFFSVIAASIIPVFHLVIDRTEEHFDALRGAIGLSDAELDALRPQLRRRTRRWQFGAAHAALALWLLQSWLLTGGGQEMVGVFSASRTEIVMAVAPLFVWQFMIASISVLVGNARLFRHLARHAQVNLLDREPLMPFGHMAATSILVLTGALASLSIMWLGGAVDPWSTIPGALLILGALCFQVLGVLRPVHLALRAARRAELERIQQALAEHADGVARLDPAALAAVEPLLAWRRVVS